MMRAIVVVMLLGGAVLTGCEPPPEAGSGPIGVAIRALDSCDGSSTVSMSSLAKLRFVVQAPAENEEDLLTTVLDEDRSVGDGLGMGLSDIPVGDQRQLTVLGYTSESTEGRPDLFGRAKGLTIKKDSETDVSLYLSAYGGYACLPTDVELTKRVFPAIVPLDDGKLLVAGGFTTATAEGAVTKLGAPSNAAFLYDPSTNSFEKVNANMQVARGAFAGAFVRSKRWVVLVGGASELKLDPSKNMPIDVSLDKGLNSFEVFDLASKSFLPTQNSSAKTMLQKRVFPRVAAMQDDTVHVYGGGAMPVALTGSGGTGYDMVDIYSPDLDDVHGGGFSAAVPAVEMLEDRSGLSVTLIEVTEDNLSRYLIWGGSGGSVLGEVYTASSLEKDGIHGAFLKVTASGDKPPMTYFHEMTRLGQGRFLLTGGLRKDGTISGDDAYVVDLGDLADAGAEIKATVKKVTGLGAGRFLHAAVATDSLHAVVFGGFTDRAFTPTGDKRAFALDSATGVGTMAIPDGEADFAPMGALLGVPLQSDAVFVFAGVASFVDELLAAKPERQSVYVYAPGNLVDLTAL
jgi:hypothetical protein